MGTDGTEPGKGAEKQWNILPFVFTAEIQNIFAAITLFCWRLGRKGSVVLDASAGNNRVAGQGRTEKTVT